MAMQNKQSMIDARWQHLQPGWGNDHSSERRALYEMLSDGEEIEALVSCTWARDPYSGKALTAWTGCGGSKAWPW